MKKEARGALRAVTAILAGVLALSSFTAAVGVGEDAGEGAGEGAAARHLSDVLMSALDSGASCGHVDYTESDPDAPTATPNPGGTVRVDLYLFVLALTEIDATTGTFRFEGYGGFVWCDPRLAFDTSAAGVDRRVLRNLQAEAALGETWWPGVFLPTQLGVPERSNELLTIHADGTLEFTAKFNTRMLAAYDFTDFPLDRQTLSIPVQTGLRGAEAVDLQLARSRIGFDRAFELPEWWIRDYDVRIDHIDTDGDGNAFARFVMDIHIGRKIGFYFWKIMLPIVIIVSISFSVFWMTRDVLAQRQRQSATGVLTLVAFQFGATGSLPRVPYLTAMDAVILWSFIVAASTMIANVINKRRFRQDEALGLRYDRRCRFAYPTVYFVGLVLIAIRRYIL